MKLNFEKGGGLIPVIVQDYETGKVLMLGFMNEEAYKKTLETGRVCFYSRTRNKLWIKGETSGHFLEVKEIYVDCDNDTLLIKVKPHGPVCHEGYESCFYRRLNSKGNWEIIEERQFQPEEVYGKSS
ncbi:MAG: phosphoribosyl-AMP cyclohydrolase [Caldimicrobium sp.]